LVVNSGPGATISYSATGLPPGMTISPTTGLISGTPTSVGTYAVIVTASEGGSSDSQSFTWTIIRASYAFDFASFTSSAGLTTNGKASVVAPVLRLTPNTVNQAGSAFLTSPVPLGPDSSFNTRFVFRMHGAADGSDGLVFIVQGNGATALGSQGNGIGYAGIGRSLAVELDTDKDGGDPNGNHIGVLSNGSRSPHLATYTPPFDMEDGLSHTLWIDYSGASNALRVYIAQGIVTQRPASPVIALTSVDLPALVGTNAWFGFSAATAKPANYHDISAWSLNVDYRPDLLQPGGFTPASEPSGEILRAVSVRITSASGENRMLDVSFRGAPLTAYVIQAVEDPSATAWETVATVEANVTGDFSFQEPCDRPARFYRAVLAR